jgi:biotin carboxylase
MGGAIIASAEKPDLRSSTLDVRALLLRCAPEHVRERVRFVWLNNFECEQFWADPGTVRLPSLSSSAESAIVNRMEEMCLWLAGEPDTVVLHEPPDPEFISYLEKIGLKLPRILTTGAGKPANSISQAILSNGDACHEIGSFGDAKCDLYLLAYGNTPLEEEVSRTWGIPLLGPRGDVCAKVNSKIFSRKLSRRLGFLTVPGFECESFEELEEAFRQMRPTVSEGRRIVLKEAMGVSGKGLLVIEQPAKMDQVLDLFRRQHKPGRKYAFVVEEWIDKKKDINYQVLIPASGDVQFLAIKESFARGAVHAGHRCPPDLTHNQLEQYRAAALTIGRELHRTGYSGIAGIDSMVDRDGKIYPVLEINARFNMSTYQLALERSLHDGSKYWVKN